MEWQWVHVVYLCTYDCLAGWFSLHSTEYRTVVEIQLNFAVVASGLDKLGDKNWKAPMKAVVWNVHSFETWSIPTGQINGSNFCAGSEKGSQMVRKGFPHLNRRWNTTAKNSDWVFRSRAVKSTGRYRIRHNVWLPSSELTNIRTECERRWRVAIRHIMPVTELYASCETHYKLYYLTVCWSLFLFNLPTE